MKLLLLILLFFNTLYGISTVSVVGISDALRQEAIAMIIEDPHDYTQMREDLQQDREVAMVAVQQKDFITRQYLHTSFKNDKEMALVAVASSPYALEFFDESIKDDQEVVFLSVSQNGYSLQYASARLRADREVVYAAVSNYGRALGFVDPSFNLDAVTALTALEDIDFVTEYMTEIIKRGLGHDGNFVFRAGKAKFADKVLFEDRDFLLKWLRSGKSLDVEMIDKVLLKDRDVLMALLHVNPYSYTQLDTKMQKDRALALIAMRANLRIFSNLDPVFKNDKTFVLLAVKTKGTLLLEADSRFLDDAETVKATVQKSPEMLGVVSRRLRDNLDMVKLAVKRDRFTIRYASKRIRSDLKFMRPLVERDNNLWMYGSDALKKEKTFLALKPGSEAFEMLMQVEKRDMASKAWNAYTVEDALDVLYGEGVTYEQGEMLNVSVPVLVTNGARMQTGISTKVKTESIALFQGDVGKKSMVAYIETPESSERGRYMISLSSTNMVTAVAKGQNGHYYISRDMTYIKGTGCFDDDLDDSITKKKYLELSNGISKMKIKSRRGETKAKIMMTSPMLTYKKAKAFGITTKYIDKVEVKAGEKTLVRLYLSQYIHHIPFLKFNWDGNYSKQQLEVVLTDIEGHKIRESVEVR